MTDFTEILRSPKKARAIAQYTIEYILEFCIAGRSLVGNDFDAAIILFAIQVYVGEKAFRNNEKNCRNLGFEDPFLEDLLVPISRLALASMTGLPKETVRRKIKRLEELGLVRKVGTRGLLMSREFAFSPERAKLMIHNQRTIKKMFSQIAALDVDSAPQERGRELSAPPLSVARR